ncbi:MAG: glycoside hydrolase family 2 TIM barrel-domain containing protein [Ignavibacteriaceae bacterium]|jgi:beta-galactosidase
MKFSNHFYKLALSLTVFVFFSYSTKSIAQSVEKEPRRILLNSNWLFALGDQSNANEVSFDDKDWRVLDLPHDWSIEGAYDKEASTGGSGGYLPTGIGWYRKHFQVTQNDLSKTVCIDFDGVYMNSEVWINGTSLGKHPYGYTSFQYELSSYLRVGENILAVRVDNSLQPNTRWYTGSGIYRNVWLVKTNKLHVAHWGISITTPKVSPESATVTVKTMVENSDTKLKNVTLRSILLNLKGIEVARGDKPFSSSKKSQVELVQQLVVQTPEIWSLENPSQYKLQTILLENNLKIDELTTKFGIREIAYDVNNGFLLNGKSIKMNGVCLHHDGGCVGAAVPIQVWKRRFEKLKEMGCNAIRTSHNPPAPEFLDLCDEMGFLVMDEPFDEWKIGKRKYGYHDYFDEWWERDLVSMIHRDRNHPSIVLWSAGNEIPEQKTEKGVEMLKAFNAIFHREDKTRPVTLACDNIVADGGATTLAFLNELDIIGYNYVDRWHRRRELFYSVDRHDHPDWKMIGTESISNNGGVRGQYTFDATGKANYNFNMIDAEQLWKFVATRDYVIGDFMWTGVDYLGEADWPEKSVSFGVLDLCGFPKDGFYFYQSQWTKTPMLHLFPHWNWKGREGEVIPVLCYTNCDAVELSLNGKSFGEKRMEFPRQGNSGGWNLYDKPQVHPTTADLHLAWDVAYEPGILKAVGKKDGKVVCIEEIRTTGQPAALQLQVDVDTLNALRRDAANVAVKVVDSLGNVVPVADNLIQFSIEGEGKIIGVDNGNPVDHAPYKSSKRKAFNGLCLAVVQSTGKAGKIKLTASAEGLNSAFIEIVSK